MRRELFQPNAEGEARLLLLIAAFSGPTKSLEGRTKLAKLDFFLRNPAYLARVLGEEYDQPLDIETGMVRYRYGPWDPAYFALLGSLIGRGLVEVIPISRGLGYRATELGARLASDLGHEPSWASVAELAHLLRRRMDFSGNHLKDLVYANFPEVSAAAWGDPL